MYSSPADKKEWILSEKYSDGKPMTVFYFDNKEDTKQKPIVHIKDGVGYADKPISFGEEQYYKNGQLRSKGRYVNGQSDGLWEYFYETGIFQAKCYYHNGLTRDTVYCWHPSGNLKRLLIEIDTTNHHWHGTDYFENGKKSVESNLSKDSLDNWIIDGKYMEWFDNGKPKFQAIVKENWTVGKWYEWDMNGNLKEDPKSIKITL